MKTLWTRPEAVARQLLSGLCALLLNTVVLKVIQLPDNSTATLVPDWRALAATFGAAMLAALVFGLPPAFRLASLMPRAGRASTIFLGAQVAVSCLLVVVSSLLVNSRQRLGATDPSHSVVITFEESWQPERIGYGLLVSNSAIRCEARRADRPWSRGARGAVPPASPR